MSDAPLQYLTSAGHRAGAIVPLTWFTIAVSVIVCLIVAIILWLAVGQSSDGDAAPALVERGGNGLRWITIGLGLTAVPLFAILIWTMVALAQIAGPPAHPGLTLDVTGKQYWWEVTYNGSLPSDRFTTANEIHIPVGVPVLVRLSGGDVIHSFWVPQLSGKTDAIPGQNNQTWMQASVPGRFRGQCSEFCGMEHARMAFEVVAEPRDQFERWRARQLQTAPPPVTTEQTRGLKVVEFRCGLCHAVRGTEAGSHFGPDLTHLMSRSLIASGALPNTPGALAGWVQNPQGIKPGSQMPDQYLSGPQLQDVTAYLATLK